ncbi:deazaflavin-dependent oxidoreductase, nitroreductase family [Actinomadura meyerae]|uniref:Deazaflavin-dependent oxidoreductase, nitroreductase family n=1 Tax=Actinomadura meyerae TaxID=240840 RepID=A0A239NGN4_9ACTN|nr:nitroreductase/quinone reductase family protein [Actinomadura meyerae]SNT54051.1 deazaflavin-dependent oxidoreductase, nitroreductase family [Actinomadura meyerae]
MTSRGVAGVLRQLGGAKRRMYRGGRPSGPMRLWNRFDALLYATGWVRPAHTAVLRVRGRRSGRDTAVPVAVADVGGAEYLVSMLGPDANWVLNVEAAGRTAVLGRRGRDVPVRLEPVPPEDRAPILRRYAAVAPGARPHLRLGPAAPLGEFARIAEEHPVYRIRER